MTDNEMIELREAIRKKYEEYRLAKPGKYPTIKFNSYPAPYEYLRTSFKEELINQGQADMQEAIAAIPSVKTLAKIFHEGYILKDEKALTTCYLYAWGKPIHIASDITSPTITPTRETLRQQPTKRILFFVGLAIGVSALAYLLVGQYASGLVIDSPANGMTVPRIMIAEGRVNDAEMVWLVIRPVGKPEYYVQAPIKVADDGTWKGPIYTGNGDSRSVGVRFLVRAFVNPKKPLIEEQIIYAWPQAELSSDIVEVVRGAQNIQEIINP
ncbi:hypothetical protein [Fibrella aquatica]|uniref:hypothetical protein n=1 Tax=Fibrella aquatica TaxID=3242487 RepID=UPI003521EC1C